MEPFVGFLVVESFVGFLGVESLIGFLVLVDFGLWSLLGFLVVEHLVGFYVVEPFVRVSGGVICRIFGIGASGRIFGCGRVCEGIFFNKFPLKLFLNREPEKKGVLKTGDQICNSTVKRRNQNRTG